MNDLIEFIIACFRLPLYWDAIRILKMLGYCKKKNDKSGIEYYTFARIIYEGESQEKVIRYLVSIMSNR